MTGSSSSNGAMVRPTWRDSDRFVPRAFVRPALRFTRVEAAGGLVMLVAALAALAWANSPWHASYESFLSTPFELTFGTLVRLELDLHADRPHLPPLIVKHWRQRKIDRREKRGLRHRELRKTRKREAWKGTGMA